MRYLQFILKRIWSKNDTAWLNLLECASIKVEQNIDYTVGIYADDILVATGSLNRNMIKCLVVQKEHQGGAVFNQLISHLLNEVYDRKYAKVFVYTKPENSTTFAQLNFQVIEEVSGQLVFMERAMHGFAEYIQELAQGYIAAPRVAAVVMNANPFTKGHLHLIETAAAYADIVHVFVVSEDVSDFPTAIRKQLVVAGTEHLKNCYIHDTSDYLVSNQTFPSYFLPETTDVTVVQATLDAQVFLHHIAPALGITDRFVGEEPLSIATAIYNTTMQEVFTEKLQLHIIPRIMTESTVISASAVRALLANKQLVEVEKYVPSTTFNFLQTSEGAAIIAAITKKTEEKE